MVWKTFEDAARFIIARHRDVFGLETVEPGPTKVEGQSGQIWDIEIVGYSNDSRKIVIFEVRRKKRNVTPEEVVAVRGRIEELQAQKGYIVTRLDRRLSKGAQKIAGFREIGHVQISADATPEAYVMKYLNQFFATVVDTMHQSDSVEAIVRDIHGNVIERR